MCSRKRCRTLQRHHCQQVANNNVRQQHLVHSRRHRNNPQVERHSIRDRQQLHSRRGEAQQRTLQVQVSVGHLLQTLLDTTRLHCSLVHLARSHLCLGQRHCHRKCVQEPLARQSLKLHAPRRLHSHLLRHRNHHKRRRDAGHSRKSLKLDSWLKTFRVR